LKVLITGGKSALALKIAKAFVQHQVVLADYGDVPLFPKFISLGKKNEDTIAHTLLSACLDEEVDVVLPLYNFEITAMAKAKVLFNEFNVDILLPNTDLKTYFYEQLVLKSDSWVAFWKGEALFMSSTDEQLIAFGKSANLNGVFYFNSAHAVANLKLITI